ncbi:hypothetical protein F5146DRAFT_1106648 [Armillaria mellea]|nr:hypothetical protein F5146DRAFT_1106648 [Armillaria mellea]
MFTANGWICDGITLQLPQSGVCHALEEAAPSFDILNVWHCLLLDIIRSAFQDASSLHFHLKGFKEHWLQPDGCMECVYGEAYTSDVFLEMEDQITLEPGCSLETVVAPMMVYSNSTCLANFGTAVLWPAYVGFGLISNHHLAYFPVLPDNIQDVYMQIFGSLVSKETLTFLKHELMQKIWKLLLDLDFIHAYVYGIIINILLASIKYLGWCLCPQCLILKTQVPEMGMKQDISNQECVARVDTKQRQHDVDLAHKWIYTQGYPVSGKHVENVLSLISLTPNRNAFSEALSPLEFNFYQMFVPDLMHESESGSWKLLFTHLVQICYEIPDAIARLNKQ